MKPALADACLIFFYVAVPALLVVRYSWPRVLPRWVVLAAVAVLGGAAFYLHEYLHRAHMLDVAQRLYILPHPAPIFVGPMTSLQGPRSGDFLVGTVSGLLYLLLWLVPYGIFRILQSRSSRKTPGP
jgi:hypothetical protein